MNMDLRGKVKFLTGGDASFRRERNSARDSSRSGVNLIARLTWCNSKADGKVRMGEDQK